MEPLASKIRPDTLAGFIIHEMEKIPRTGERMQWKVFSFEIADMDNHRIDKVLVTVKEIDDADPV